MSNTASPDHSRSVDAIYAQLNERDIAEFYAGYQRWNLQQQIAALQTRLDDLRQQIAENTEHMQEVHPTAIALATLARLQANGVSDIDLLDRMLERGELWLDRIMQRLDYFEHVDDFISDDYTQWCQLALDGAYDWIDSVLDDSPSSLPQAAVPGEETLTEATEELVLQKLRSDEYDDESSMLEVTLKRPAISITHLSLEQPVAAFPIASDEQFDIPEYIAPEEAPFVEDTSTSDGEPTVGEPTVIEYFTTFEEPLSLKGGAISDSDPSPMQEYVEVSPTTEKRSSISPESLHQSDEPVASEVYTRDKWDNEARLEGSVPEDSGQHPQSGKPKRPNFLRRFIEKIWGS